MTTPSSRPASRRMAKISSRPAAIARPRVGRSTGKRSAFQEGHEFLATGAVFFPTYDGWRPAPATTRFASGTSPGTQTRCAEPTGRIGTLAVSPDGDWLVTGSPGNDAIWDSHSGQSLATLTGHTAEVSALAFSPQGDLLASGDDRGTFASGRKKGRPGSGRSPASSRPQPLDHGHEVHARRQAARQRERRPHLWQWDIATGEELKQLVLKHPEYVSSLDLSPDGTLAITTCDDGTARVWRLADAQ